MSSTLCFVCSRCELPICTRDDVLMSPVPGGTSESAFAYFLEDILGLDTAVPCYSGDEVAEVKVTVFEELLESVLPPPARPLGLNEVIESQPRRRRQQQQHREGGGQSEQNAQETATDYSTRTGLHGAGISTTTVLNNNNEAETLEMTTEENNDFSSTTAAWSPREGNSSTGSTRHEVMRTLARHSRVQESRVDIICVREHVLGIGLAICRMGGGVMPAELPAPRDSDEEREEQVEEEERGEIEEREVAQGQTFPTQWGAHPGNFVLEESFVKVQRSTKSAEAPWFKAYDCIRRLECPDCHLGLGYLFVRRPERETVSEGTSEEEEEITLIHETGIRSNEDGEEGEEHEHEHEPQQKKERRDQEGEEKEENNNNAETLQYPTSFVGLELKKIRQREWGLVDFQRRHIQAKKLKTFRELFPEAEELKSLYGRLTAFRVQSELYNNLLRKHKERNDVQSALLQSQKERLQTYEEKLRTMQQIIDAQREQLDMQGRQIKHQEELVKNHKSQVFTQQKQIHVEQLLLSEQSRTIESQREQLSLIQAHLKARLMKEKLDERCEQLTRLLHDVGGERQSRNVSTDATTTSVQSLSRLPLPPPHLMGIVGRDTRGSENANSQEVVRTSEEASTDVNTRGRVGSPRLSVASAGVDRATYRSLEVSERAAAILRRVDEERARRYSWKESGFAGGNVDNNNNNNNNNSCRNTVGSGSNSTAEGAQASLHRDVSS